MTEAQAAPATPHGPLHQRYPWLLPGGGLLLLVLLTMNEVTHGPLIRVDRRLHKLVHATGNSAGWRWLKDGHASPARLLVDLGDVRVAIPVLMVIAAAQAARRRTLRPVLTAATGVALLLGTVLPVQFVIGRLEPASFRHHRLLHVVLGGFPSGHAAAACVCFFLAALIILPDPGARGRRTVLAAVAVLAFLVGAAMVWCDLHRPTDVVAGWALSAVIIPLTIRLTGERAGPGRPGLDRPAASRALAASTDPGSG